VADGNGDKEQLEGIIEFCRGLGELAIEGLDDLLLGGTEEMIVERGSDWCSDVARVACVTCQRAGLPARIVSLFNTGQAYSGHSIIEVYRAPAPGERRTQSTGSCTGCPTARPPLRWNS
tara:strand:+ start:156 stop:512 length:357 start_codon:yes stop_codon:yes gene_type:complete